MTKLIVDLLYSKAPINLIQVLRNEVGIDFFKLNIKTLLKFPKVLDELEYLECNSFFDFKIYDTKDSVYELAREAFFRGATFLTVHTSVVEYAMKAKQSAHQKVLAVAKLTDGSGAGLLDYHKIADGFICSVSEGDLTRHQKNQIIVCPGIRLEGDKKNDHRFVYTPKQAKDAGIDYIVMGRSIIDNPVENAKRVLKELA